MIDWNCVAAILRPTKGAWTTYNYRGAGPFLTPGVSLAQWNGVNVIVRPPSGTNISADIHVQGNFAPGGFSDVADPNGVVLGASTTQNLDVVVGALYVAVKLVNIAGTPNPGQQWEVTITPCNLPGTRNRSNYYDRNPTISMRGFEGVAIGPHGFTIRASYTVPVGKKAYVENFFVQAMRFTAGSAAGTCSLYVQYVPISDGNTYKVFEQEFQDNTPGAHVEWSTGNVGLIITGDQVYIADQDGSTGGTVNFRSGIKFTEFDA